MQVVEEFETQPANLDGVAASQQGLGEHPAVHTHPAPAREIPDLESEFVAGHEQVVLGAGGDADIAQDRLTHQRGRAVEIERAALPPRLPL